jgi:hypothetical protein
MDTSKSIYGATNVNFTMGQWNRKSQLCNNLHRVSNMEFKKTFRRLSADKISRTDGRTGINSTEGILCYFLNKAS